MILSDELYTDYTGACGVPINPSLTGLKYSEIHIKLFVERWGLGARHTFEYVDKHFEKMKILNDQV